MGPRGGVRALAALGDFARNVGLNVLEPALSIGRLHETLASDGTDLDGQYDVQSLIHTLETAVRNHPQGIGESTP